MATRLTKRSAPTLPLLIIATKPMSLRDLVSIFYAPTFPAFSNRLVLQRAMAETGRPYALALMLHPNGTMLDGTPPADAIARIDAEISPPPRHYYDRLPLSHTRTNSAAGLCALPSPVSLSAFAD